MHDLCENNWNIDGTLRSLHFSGLTISSLEVAFVGTYNDVKHAIDWQTTLSGALTFEEFAAQGRLIVTGTNHTELYIDFTIDSYAGVIVDISLLYNQIDGVSFASGTAEIDVDALGGSGDRLQLNAAATYCSAPLTNARACTQNSDYKFYISTTEQFDYGVFGRSLGSAQLVLARVAKIVNFEPVVQPWEFSIIGSTGLPELKDDLGGTAKIVLAESQIQSFTIQVSTSFEDIVSLDVGVNIQDPGHCQKGTYIRTHNFFTKML